MVCNNISADFVADFTDSR